MSVKILAVGDVCGEPGLKFLESELKNFKKERNIDFTVVNGENANVVGVTPKQADAIFRAGADVITLGNHTWTRTELQPYLAERSRILRPANFGPQCPGRGIGVYSTSFGDVCVLNLMGRFTLDSNTDNPFVIADGYMEEIKEKVIQRKAGHGLPAGRQGQCGVGYPYPCPDLRRLRIAQGHRLYKRSGHDRGGTFRPGHRPGTEHRQIHGRPAQAL